ncbi:MULTISPECIES: ABC transporter permease [unclassified Roseitalea]|uniref:ABC transporter permease n=1 Tax=unclassified Roseitalea TaxID=2639107 RepID=UPI00273CF99C|nr:MULTISPECIES: ABC transporter permease [unclassified Roseitalea]
MSVTSDQSPTRQARGLSLGGLLRNEQIFLIILLAVLIVGLSLAAPRFMTAENATAILHQSAMVLIVAVGMTMLLITAEVDISVGASLAFASCVVMDVINTTSSLTLGILAGLAFGGGVGLFNGLVVTRLKVNSLIATIATMMILQGGVFLYTREAVQNHHQIEAFSLIATGYVGPVPVPVIIAALLAVVFYVMLNYTLIGRRVFAVGSNPKAARLSGLSPETIKLVAFVVTGILVGVAATILASLLNAGQPTAGRGFELIVIAAVLLGGTSLFGGKGTIAGTILGVLILKIIDNGIIILRWNQDLQIIVPGVVIILAMFLDQLRKGRTDG